MGALHSAVENTILRMREARIRKSAVWGLPTGFNELDELIGGLHPGEVTIIAARPSVGKSSLISQITFNAAVSLLNDSITAGEPVGQVLYFSPEMLPEDLIRRQVSQITEIPLSKIRTGRTTDEEAELAEQAARSVLELGSVLHLMAGKPLEISEIMETVSTANRMGPRVRLVAVDYLTRIDAGSGSASEYSVANKLSRLFKDMSLSQKVPVMVGAQLSRKGDRQGNDDDPMSRFPRMTDLRDSGRIEEDADSVWLIHREKELRTDQEPRLQAATLIVDKNRNGPTGIVELVFEPHLTRFSDANVPEDIEFGFH